MINITLLKETFLYFAKFPALAGVQRNFNISEGNSDFSGYDTFLNEVSNLATHSLIPGIVEYVFGVDELLVKKRIEDITGVYLFVDYGNITTVKNDIGNRLSEFVVAVTVARPIKQDDMDFSESVLLGDLMLSYLATIKEQMETDSPLCKAVREITFPVEITPWFSRELFNSTGWTMLFTKTGTNLV